MLQTERRAAQGSGLEEDPSQTTTSVGPQIFRGRPRWLSESYNVRDKFVQDVVRRLGCGEPTVDGFATAENRRCEKWWGPGSPHGEDAFQQPWEGQLVWLNPPFSHLR